MHLVTAIDIEASSTRLGPGSILSIGACLYEVSTGGPGKILRSFCMNIAWPNGPVFDRVTEAFWNHHADALEVNTRNGFPPTHVASEFSLFLDECQQQVSRRAATYTILTDNRQFDVGWLEWFLAQYAPENSTTVLHSKSLGPMFNFIVDLRQRQHALRDIGIRLARPPTARPDHTPYTDACFLAERYELYLRVCKNMAHTFHLKPP
jgi:hypothetical protein